MKILTIPLVFSALLSVEVLCAQAPAQPPVGVTPGAPAIGAPGQSAAAPPAPIAPDTVVAEVDGQKLTAGEMDKVIAMLPAQYQQAAKAQPQMLGQIFLMRRLAEDAEKAGVDKKEPYKDQLQMSRIQLLSTAELSEINNNTETTEAEQKKYYEDNPDKFKQVKVRAIYISFGPAPPKPIAGDNKAATDKDAKPEVKKLTEPEAKAKIEDLAKQIMAGADFGMLAHDVSDDKTSAAKNGDFGVIKQDSPYPQNLKTAIFALKQGELSMPIRQPAGYYLVRAEEVTVIPYADSLVEIIKNVKQAKFQEWLKGMQAQYKVKIENPGYFTPHGPPPFAPPVPQPVH
jgi:peptidyl-prolyl cis-trans isomerase C